MTETASTVDDDVSKHSVPLVSDVVRLFVLTFASREPIIEENALDGPHSTDRARRIVPSI